MTSVVSAERPTGHHALIGSCLVCLGIFLMACNDTIMKLGHFRGLKVSQMIWGRFVVQSVLSFAYWTLYKPPSSRNWYGDAPYVLNIWVRALCYGVAAISGCYAMIVLPLGDAGTIIFQAPLLTALLTHFVLNEKLPTAFPAIVILGFSGIVFICQPSFLFEGNPLRWDGVFAAVLCLMSCSIAAFLVRTALGAHFIQLEVVSSLQAMVVYVPLMMVLNQTAWEVDLLGTWRIGAEWEFDAVSVGLILAMGLIGFVGVYCSITGYQYAEATRVAWMEYTNLVFLFLFQIFVFNHVPNTYEAIGVGLVVLSCAANIVGELYFSRGAKAPILSMDQTGSDADSEFSVFSSHSSFYDDGEEGGDDNEEEEDESYQSDSSQNSCRDYTPLIRKVAV